MGNLSMAEESLEVSAIVLEGEDEAASYVLARKKPSKVVATLVGLLVSAGMFVLAALTFFGCDAHGRQGSSTVIEHADKVYVDDGKQVRSSSIDNEHVDIDTNSLIMTPSDPFLCVVSGRVSSEDHRAPLIKSSWNDEVEVTLEYLNTSGGLSQDVWVQVTLPEGLHYVDGSAVLYNSSNPNGVAVRGEESMGGWIDLGGYYDNTNFYYRFKVSANESMSKNRDSEALVRCWVYANDVMRYDDLRIRFDEALRA